MLRTREIALMHGNHIIQQFSKEGGIRCNGDANVQDDILFGISDMGSLREMVVAEKETQLLTIIIS